MLIGVVFWILLVLWDKIVNGAELGGFIFPYILALLTFMVIGHALTT